MLLRLLEAALRRLKQAGQAAMMVGGERYLSGRIQFDETEAYDGDLWPSVALKAKGILNPCFLKATE